MNTHDIDIELPPLPEPFTYTLPGKLEGALYHAGHMQDYACAAVEADRQGRMQSDDELLQLASECCDSTDATGEEPRFTTDDSILRFARALLSRYGNGQPAISGQAETRMNAGFAARNGGDLGQPAASAEPRPDEYDYFVDWYEEEAPDENEVRNFDMARQAWLAGVRFAGLFPAAAPVAQEPVAWSTPDGREPISAELKRARPDLYGKSYAVPLGIIAAPVAAQVQAVVNQQMTTAASDVLADTQRAIIEAAERRGYERGLAECTQDREDSERYRPLRRGQHWSVINGIGEALRAESLDAAIDAARAAREE